MHNCTLHRLKTSLSLSFNLPFINSVLENIESFIKEEVKEEPLNAEADLAATACQICGKAFRSRTALADHRAFHEGRTQCSVCNKLCSTVANLRRHLKSHTSTNFLFNDVLSE